MPEQQNKCAYRMRVEDLLRQDRQLPKALEDCEDCTGIHSQIEKPCYIDLEHVLNFREYTLNQNEVSHSQR
jgi:hypothetical protein